MATRTNGTTRTATPPTTPAKKPAADPKELARSLRNVVNQKYGVTLKTRSQRVREAVYYELRNLITGGVAAGIRKAGKSADRQKLNKLFEKLFGTAEAPTYDVMTMAAIAAEFSAEVDTDSKQGIKDLLRLNKERLQSYNAQSADDDEDEDMSLETGNGGRGRNGTRRSPSPAKDEDDELLDELINQGDDATGDEESDDDSFNLDEDEDE
ncbi:MAG: hypothetical protein NW224_12855 [Leptolyngbyaceae cyanobacterium bins.302]|nr:hypothetical protein [Leptolyngbyaceae cyanobacterium bins.302]